VLDVLGQLLDEEDYDVTLSPQFLDRDAMTPLHPDVIITDAAFNHGPDGECLFQEPLKRSDGTAIPVVYSTTIPDVAARLSARMIPILLKPFDLDLLVTLIGRVIPQRAH
jgi:DNA-binding NtrC family response regulator